MPVSINSVWSSKTIDLKLTFRERAINLSFYYNIYNMLYVSVKMSRFLTTAGTNWSDLFHIEFMLS